MDTAEFVIPPRENLRERFTYKVEDGETKWPTGSVTVLDNGEPVYNYKRNYSMLRTFEPFRQLRDGQWKNYAFISPSYTSFEVLDLQTHEVVAKRSPSVEQLQRAQEVIDKYKNDPNTSQGMKDWYAKGPEAVARSWGFCPVEFYVPDWWDEWDHDYDSFDKYFGPTQERGLDPEDRVLTGEFALYSGCVWGDDHSWKVEYIDLSRLSEGVVTADDRFGYIELPPRIKLRDAVTYYPESRGFQIAVALTFGMDGYVNNWTYENINHKEESNGTD